MRYVVEIPKPSAKRLENDRRLIIECHSGWGAMSVAEHAIPVGEEIFEFEFAGPICHEDPNVLDGDYYHKFYIEYRNSTGSRRERASVKPIEL